MNKRYRQIVRIYEKCEKMRHYFDFSNPYEIMIDYTKCRKKLWKYNLVVDLQERAIDALFRARGAE